MKPINYDGSKHPYLANYLAAFYPNIQLYILDGEWVANVEEPEQLEQVIADYNPMEAALIAANQTADQWHSEQVQLFKAQYTEEEIATWPAKQNVARAYLAGTATEAEIEGLEDEAPAQGRTPEEHAQRILELSGQYFKFLSRLSKVRELVKLAIPSCETLEDLQVALSGLTLDDS